MPQISIIVPVYNVEKYLEKCVDSILAQTFTDFELILIDDGSSDKCPGVCDYYAKRDPRVIVIHQKNAGVSAARNSGLTKAKGEYLAFCDSDDSLHKDYIENLLSLADTNNAELVTAGYTKVTEQGKVLGTYSHHQESFGFHSMNEAVAFIINSVLNGNIGWEIWTKLFRRSIVVNNGIRFCETCDNFAEDLGFVIEYLLYCQQVNVSSSIGYYYLNRTDSMMGTSKTIIRLNSMNEVSKQFGTRYQKTVQYDPNKLALAHYLIMNNQYKKIVMTEEYSNLPEELDKIVDQKWYRKKTKRLFCARKELYDLFGKSHSQQILLLSSFCLHRNWKLHTYFSALFYKFVWNYSA